MNPRQTEQNKKGEERKEIKTITKISQKKITQ